MTQKVVTLFDNYGGSFDYKRFGARLPDFLKAYPPSEYRIETVFTDLLSLQTGRLALLKEAIACGKKPADVGLPGIEADINTLVCTAVMYDRQNQIIRKASASMCISEHKDFESLETAAQQRLLALLGFGGQVFDEDEDHDMHRQGLSGPSPTVVPQTTSTNTDPPASVTTSRPRGVPVALRRQVENLARQLDVKVGEISTEEQARGELQRLGEIQKERRAS